MTQRTVVIGSRTATVGRDGQPPVDARSLLSVLAPGARHGESVVLSAEGEGADAAVEEPAGLVARGLDARE